MSAKRNSMVFILTDAHRDMLEAFRAKRGLRSAAEALRVLIEDSAVAPAARPARTAPGPTAREIARALGEPGDSSVGSATGSVPTLQRKAFNPQPKKGKR
jgi:hypothetical protein